MRTLPPGHEHSERSQDWPRLGLSDEPGLRSLNAFLCELTSTRELHDALRLISEEVRNFLSARFVAVMVFEDDNQSQENEVSDPDAVVVPLLVSGRRTGQINAYFDRVRALTKTEARVMEMIAAVAAITLENARSLQRERRRLVQAEAINSLAPNITRAATHDELARLVVASLRDKLHYDSVRVFWRHSSEEELVCLASFRALGASTSFDQAGRDLAAVNRVVRDGAPLLIADPGDWQALAGLRVAAGLRSLIAIPIMASWGTAGVLEVGARSPRAFDQSDIEGLMPLATHFGVVAKRLNADGRRAQPHEQDRGRTEWLSTMVHDLRGPLSLIKGYATTMIRLHDSLSKDKGLRFLNGVDEAADRLAVMVDHLAGVSRLDSGQYRPKLEQVDLGRLVAEVVDRIRPQLGEHPLTLELPGGVVPMHVDVEHLARCIGNLVFNATRYSDEGGRIIVRVSRHDGPLGSAFEKVASAEGLGIVEIRDEGQAIPRDQLDKVFEKFYRPNGNGRKKGTGLELYVAKKVIEAHGGRVWVQSEAGQGNTFGFALPLTFGDDREQADEEGNK